MTMGVFFTKRRLLWLVIAAVAFIFLISNSCPLSCDEYIENGEYVNALRSLIRENKTVLKQRKVNLSVES